MSSDSTKKWLARVDYDLETAEAMLNARRYIYAVFMCQQAIEKCLKAVIIHRGAEVAPIHNLRRLVEAGNFKFDEDTLVKLDFLSQYYINARYKEDLDDLSKGMTKEIASEFVVFAKELIGWLKKEMK